MKGIRNKYLALETCFGKVPNWQKAASAGKAFEIPASFYPEGTLSLSRTQTQASPTSPGFASLFQFPGQVLT